MSCPTHKPNTNPIKPTARIIAANQPQRTISQTPSTQNKCYAMEDTIAQHPQCGVDERGYAGKTRYTCKLSKKDSGRNAFFDSKKHLLYGKEDSFIVKNIPIILY